MTRIKAMIKGYLSAGISGKVLLRMGLALFFINWLFQRVFRLNADSTFPVHFTSRIICPERLYIEPDEDVEVIFSIASSHACYLQAINGIYLGKGTIFAPSVTIVSANHNVSNYNEPTRHPPIRIGRYCWIGASSIVCPGVELGDNTIVGAGSVVTKSFPEGHVVIGGVPARVLKDFSVK